MMRQRRGLLSAATRGALAVYFMAVGMGGTALPAGAAPSPARSRDRVVAVLVLADSSFKKNEAWKTEFTYAMMDSAQFIRETAGIKLTVKSFAYWTPPSMETSSGGSAVRPLLSYLPPLRAHIREAGRGACDIVVALAPEGREEPVKGVADYLEGLVIVKRFHEKNRIPSVLLHELCHLFGAVDLMEDGSVMSRRNPKSKFDPFTTAVMRIHRDRTFRGESCPLPRESALRAIEIYRKRQELRLGEDMLTAYISQLGAVRKEGNT